MEWLVSALLVMALHPIQVECIECGTCGAWLVEPTRYYIPDSNNEWVAVCRDCFYLK